MRFFLPMLLTLSLTGPAFASDGVLEISQTCAVETGCFEGDSAGFPVTIPSPGSYRLTSNLVVSSENLSAILVNANNVGIDLNNFSISGPVVCSGNPVVCTPASGSGSGVARGAGLPFSTSVKNGVVTGMGNHGVQLGDYGEVTGLRVRANRVGGIVVGLSSIVRDNTVSLNGANGITVNAGANVSGNVVFRNGLAGVTGLNGGYLVSNNTVQDNVGDGLQISFGSTANGNASYNNGGHGISSSGGSLVLGNSVRGNTGFGLSLSPSSSYGDNTISSNTAGTVTGTLIVNTGGNACNGTATCP